MPSDTNDSLRKPGEKRRSTQPHCIRVMLALPLRTTTPSPNVPLRVIKCHFRQPRQCQFSPHQRIQTSWTLSVVCTKGIRSQWSPTTIRERNRSNCTSHVLHIIGSVFLQIHVGNTKNTQNELFMAIDETKKNGAQQGEGKQNKKDLHDLPPSKRHETPSTPMNREDQVRSAADVNHAVDKNCFLPKPSRSFTKGEGPRHARPRAKRHLRGAWRTHGRDSDPDLPDHLSFARQ